MPLQQDYFDMLMAHVRADRYPSHQLLSRIEACLWTSDQIEQYVAMLIEKIQRDHYPSHQLLDRLERMLTLAATVA
jgi:hypothetical protein